PAGIVCLYGVVPILLQVYQLLLRAKRMPSGAHDLPLPTTLLEKMDTPAIRRGRDAAGGRRGRIPVRNRRCRRRAGNDIAIRNTEGLRIRLVRFRIFGRIGERRCLVDGTSNVHPHVTVSVYIPEKGGIAASPCFAPRFVERYQSVPVSVGALRERGCRDRY